MMPIEDSIHVAPIASSDSIGTFAGDSTAVSGKNNAAQNRGTTLAARVANEFSGSSPSRIDSVIQARLPKRELRLSNRPDTLNIPGIEGRLGYTAVYLDNYGEAYKQGYFTEDSYLRPSLPTITYGSKATPIPYMLWRDNWVTGSLLLSFIILIYVINRTRLQFFQQAKDFFYSPSSRSSLFAEETSFESHAVFFMIFLLSLLGGLMTFVFSQYTFDLFLSQVSPYFLLFVYVCCFLAYFAIKRVSSDFANWVFFEKSQQKLWVEATSFLISIECLLIFPVALIFVYFNISIVHTLIILGIIIGLAKILLVYKCYSIFFPKFYCLFHLFAYLCALELMPMLALWKSLTFITDNLIIKY